MEMSFGNFFLMQMVSFCELETVNCTKSPIMYDDKYCLCCSNYLLCLLNVICDSRMESIEYKNSRSLPTHDRQTLCYGRMNHNIIGILREFVFAKLAKSTCGLAFRAFHFFVQKMIFGGVCRIDLSAIVLCICAASDGFHIILFYA